MAQHIFNSIDEIKEFVKMLKGTRGGKGGDSDDAPTNAAPNPIMPPNTAGAVGFQGAATAAANPFGGAGAAPSFGGAAPEVMVLVNRITTRLDALSSQGQPQDQMLAWFRQQFGPEAAGADMAAIRAHFLPKLTTTALENIVKLTGA